MRVRGLVLITSYVLAMGTGPVAAQSLQWGVWGKPPERIRGNPSYLGLSAAAKARAEKEKKSALAVKPKAPKVARFLNGFDRGSVVIDTSRRRLFFTLSNKKAYSYPIAVGRRGFAWTGVEKVSRVESWPDWIPPAEMRKRQPYLPKRMKGGPGNPLGAKAIYLGDTLYRIHGTNSPKSIGTASSSGCFRMHNRHVLHLAKLVNTGSTVYVMKRLPRKGWAMPPPMPKPEPVAVKATADDAAAAKAAATAEGTNPTNTGTTGQAPVATTKPDGGEPPAVKSDEPKATSDSAGT